MEETSVVCYKQVYAVINNIPSFYRSADLRRFFSQFVETKGFDCFHFRHRPEHQSIRLDTGALTKPSEKHIKTLCCVIRVLESRYTDLIRTYHQRHWLDGKGESISSRCLISKLKIKGAIESSKEVSDTCASDNSRPVMKYQTRGDKKRIPPDREEFKEEDLLKLPEIRPPPVMPNGNVGTTTMHFMKLIQECKLPPSIIRKLQLDFPKSKSKGKYGCVPFDYQTDVVEISDDSAQSPSPELQDVTTGTEENEPPLLSNGDSSASFAVAASSSLGDDGDRSVSITSVTNDGESEACAAASTSVTNTSAHLDMASDSTTTSEKLESQPDYREARRLKKLAKKERRKLINERIEEKMIEFEKGGSDSGDDNDCCEEWERHEAMYDDVTNQGRNKDQLYEEEMEIVWEKGGSGLVFYTDAQYWHEEEGDFDEQTADDLDVDMSAYYEAGAGDKDIRDFIAIRQEQRRRRGLEPTDRHSAGISASDPHIADSHLPGIGKFEQHTKGIGRKILEKQGWTDGEGLGKSVHGIADALDNDGQHPKDKKGLGYRGEKIVRYGSSRSKSRKRKHEGEVHIATVYDNPTVTDPVEPLLRRNDPSYIKHRDRIN